MAGLGQRFDRHRPLIGKLLFEIAIIFIGVTAAFALEAARQEREEGAYRSGVIAAMIPTFDDIERHNRLMIAETEAKLKAFDAALAAGETPLLPIFREGGSERPPMRAWDGIVASGVTRALPPDLYFELSLFYTRQESLGERNVRYITTAERDILTLGPEQRGVYAPDGKLKPQYAAFVDRLRDLVTATKELDVQARELKARLRALN